MRERLNELLRHLRFEADHPAARISPLAVLKKTIMVFPQAVMFLLFNFGSSFRRAQRAHVANEPADPPVVPLLELAIDEPTRGLPFSDSTVEEVIFNGYEVVPDPIFAMSEIHRVLQPEGQLTLRFAGRFVDPRQLRAATRESIEFFTTGDSKLFDLTRSGDGEATLQAHKEHGSKPSPRLIDIGCGTAKRPGFVGIDTRPLPGVDIVRDVERHGLPFSGDTIAGVYASHFLEHVRGLVEMMNEIHRVCCTGAEVEIVVPTLLGPWAVADPTHVRLFNARTFEYFTSARLPEGEAYGGVAGLFEIVEQRVSTSMYVRLRVVK